MSIESARRDDEEIRQIVPVRTIEAVNDNEVSQPISTIEPFANDNEVQLEQNSVSPSEEQQLAEVREHLGLFVPMETPEEGPQLSEESIEAVIEEMSAGNTDNAVALAQATAAAGAAGTGVTTPEGPAGTGASRELSGSLKVLWSVLKYGGLALVAIGSLLINGLRVASEKIIDTTVGIKATGKKKAEKAGGGHDAGHGGGGHGGGHGGGGHH